MKQILLASLFLLFLSCDTSKQAEQDQKPSQEEESQSTLSKNEEIWLKFAVAMENQEIDFLLANSLDTLQCSDCDLDAETEFFPANLVLGDRLPELKHFEAITERDYSIHEEEDLFRVNYPVKSEQVPEGGYNVIYTFVKKGEQYFFKGMFTIP